MLSIHILVKPAELIMKYFVLTVDERCFQADEGSRSQCSFFSKPLLLQTTSISFIQFHTIVSDVKCE